MYERSGKQSSRAEEDNNAVTSHRVTPHTGSSRVHGSGYIFVADFRRARAPAHPTHRLRPRLLHLRVVDPYTLSYLFFHGRCAPLTLQFSYIAWSSLYNIM